MEIGCPGCGHVYSEAEVKELLRQQRLVGKGDRLPQGQSDNEVS